MLTNQTMEKLKSYGSMSSPPRGPNSQKNPEHVNLSFDERLGLLVDAGVSANRENRDWSRLLKEAKSGSARLCNRKHDYGPKPRTRQSRGPPTRDLSLGPGAHAVLISGATGTGKTYLACALGPAAAGRGHSALYRPPRALRPNWPWPAADGHLRAGLARIAPIDVLVIDDWGLAQRAD